VAQVTCWPAVIDVTSSRKGNFRFNITVVCTVFLRCMCHRKKDYFPLYNSEVPPKWSSSFLGSRIRFYLSEDFESFVLEFYLTEILGS
jgi:hypothetical protein